MDPFAEKDLIELLKSIALSMKEIKDELFDIKIAIRDLNLDNKDDFTDKDNFNEDSDEEERKNRKLNNTMEDDSEKDSEKEDDEKESGEKFSVANEDSFIEAEPNKVFEEDDKLESDDEFKEDSTPLF